MTDTRKEFYDLFFCNFAALLEPENLRENLINFEKLIKNIRAKNNKIFFLGEGGTSPIASMASFYFTNFLDVKSYSVDNMAMVTSFTKNYGHENSILRAIQLLVEPRDCLVLITSDEESKGFYKVASYAKNKNISLVTFTGHSENNLLKKIGDINFWCDSEIWSVISAVHLLWITSVFEYIASSEKEKIGSFGRIIGTPNEF